MLTPTQPGQPIVLWTGRVHRQASADETSDGTEAEESAQGEVRLVWRRGFDLEWAVETSAAADLWRFRDFGSFATELGFEFGGTVTYLPIGYLERGRGWSNGGDIGIVDCELVEVRALLVNFPMILNGGYVHDHETHDTWPGHFQVDAAGWRITIDCTRDHQEHFAQAKRDQTYALTHTLRLVRLDGGPFWAADADNVLSGLQYGLSFAAGYWVGLILPTGFDAANEPAWCQWGAPHAGRAQRGSGWWSDSRADDLADYLQRFLHHWNQPDPTEPLRFAVTSAILSNATGFVEQRLLGAVAALDHLSWTDEVLGMEVDEMKWRKRGDKRLRRLLLRISVDPANSSVSGKGALAEYGAAREYHDLAASVFEVRNRLIHPRPGENVYASPGVLLEAWRHASYWLELAILHRLGFTGEVHDRTVPGRWVGDSVLVPWGRTREK